MFPEIKKILSLLLSVAFSSIGFIAAITVAALSVREVTKNPYLVGFPNALGVGGAFVGTQIFDYFSKKSQEDFFSKEYKVTKLTDRMGMRLEGEKLENTVSKNIRSEGITKGSIQIPGDGQPIVLLSDHPTIGGYPKIANVITADYDKLVQKTQGSKIKFKLVDLVMAENAFEDYITRLNNF